MTQEAELQNMTIPQKLNWLQDRYWRFGQDEAFEDHLRDLYDVDDNGLMTANPRRDPLTDETAGLMVLGGTGNGKSAMLKRALRANPVLTEFSVENPGNTLFITVPPEATIKKVAEIILEKTGYTKIDRKLRAADAWEIARHRFGLVGIKTLMIDECHHILRAGPGRDVLAAIQSLKHIMQSKPGVALVIAGVPSLQQAIMSEPSGETYRRFGEYHLSRIREGTRSAELFAVNFAKSANQLGIYVTEKDAFVERVLFAQGGEVGRCVALAKDILRDAVIRKLDVLSLEHAERVYLKKNGDRSVTPFASRAWSKVLEDLQSIGWGR